jgi:mRNA-degrading endonuclease RelE of RelBE toxin-antitoxin system
MARRPRYTITYSPEVSRHVDAILPHLHREIRRAIEERLSFMPGSATRNRKPLEDQPGPYGATWELRCGARNQFRVFYEFSSRTREVWVLAIGLKDRERLFIAGEEFAT